MDFLTVKQQKNEIVSFLNKKGRRIELVIYSLILLFVAIAPVYIFSYTASLVNYVVSLAVSGLKIEGFLFNLLQNSGAILGEALAIACVIFIAFPVIDFYFKLVYRIYRDGAAGRTLSADGLGGGYMRSVARGSVFGVSIFCCALPFIILTGVTTSLAGHSDERIAVLASYLFFFVFALGVALGFLVFMLFRPLFLFGYYAARGKKVGESLSLSVKAMRTPLAKAMYKDYIKYFIPYLLLAIPTLFVLFLIDTLPKMMIAYYRMAETLENRE